MKNISRLMAAAVLTLGLAASAQAQKSEAFSTFSLEYNPTTRHASAAGATHDTGCQGFSASYSHFVPVGQGLGIDFGVKGQLLFSSETVTGTKEKLSMFSGTIPVDLAYDWRISDGFAVYPYAGAYARFNINASWKTETADGFVTKYNLFKKNDMAIRGSETWNRFQLGWQAGVNFRFSDTFIVGGGYFMDLTEVCADTKLKGFNIALGMFF